MKREFFYQDDRSNKFWTVEVSGKEVVTTNGRIGASPRETRKSLADPAAARREADKLVASKLRGGYREGAIAKAPAHVKPTWAAMKMSEAVFWRLIKLFDWKKTGDDDEVLKPARVALGQMSVDDIHAFDDLLADKLYALDTEAHAQSIGEAAYVDEDAFFSVDEFLYARCCAVANGEAFFAKVLSKPSAMLKDMEFESILYLAGAAFTEKTGKDYGYAPKRSFETFSNAAGWPAKSKGSARPKPAKPAPKKPAKSASKASKRSRTK